MVLSSFNLKVLKRSPGRLLLHLLQFLSTLLLAALPLLKLIVINNGKFDVWEIINNFLINHKLLIVIILTVFISSVSIIDKLNYPFKSGKKIRKEIMKKMLKDLFYNDAKDIRITIFLDNSFLGNFLYSVKDFFISRFGRTIEYSKGKRKKNKYKDDGFLGKYMKVSERLGVEFPNSKTYFRYSADTQKHCQGVAGVIRHDMVALGVNNLPDIENLNLDSVDLKGRTSAASQVKDYMERCYIKDIETLKRLNRRSRHLYGNILFDLDGEPIGVMMIDSLKEASPFNSTVNSDISLYIELIGKTYYN